MTEFLDTSAYTYRKRRTESQNARIHNAKVSRYNLYTVPRGPQEGLYRVAGTACKYRYGLEIETRTKSPE